MCKNGALGPENARKISFDLISALYYLHSHRILHRDLKPPNILLHAHENFYKAKLCDFGLARNMTTGTQILTSVKGTPLYMAPEVLRMDARGYGYKADLWSLGCIIFEMLAGESPFSTTTIIQLVERLKSNHIKWPTFLTGTFKCFLKRLLILAPELRMEWSEILSHEFVKGNVLILSDDKISDMPFTTQSEQKSRHAASIEQISRLKKRSDLLTDDVMSSRDSIKVNLQSETEVEETDNEQKNDSDDFEGCRERFDMDPEKIAALQNFQQLRLEPPRIHNIANFQPNVVNFQPIVANFQPVAENMIMHRLMNNVDTEFQNFMMAPMFDPPEMFALVPCADPVQKITQNLEDFSLRMEKSVEPSLKKSQSTVVSSVPIETDEWIQFLFTTMQEILDGDLEIYKPNNMMMTMIVGLLRNKNLHSKLIDHVCQIVCLPYSLELPQSIIDDINKLYLQMKLVPNLVYASKLLCGRKISQNSMDTMAVPKPAMVRFNGTDLKTLSLIYDAVMFLVYSDERNLNFLCDAILLLLMDHLFRSFIDCGDSQDGSRLTSSVIALFCAVLQDLPEHASLIAKIIFHDDIDLVKLMKHDDAKVRLRTCLLLRLLGRFCCCELQKKWSHEMKRSLRELTIDTNHEVGVEARNVVDEFKDFVWWMIRA